MAPPLYRYGSATSRRRLLRDRYRPYPFLDHDRRPSPSLSDEDRSLPKNFTKPLTCFFWKQNGKCNKRDVDCAYAHWETGYLATAPVSLPSGQSIERIAGKQAEIRLSDMSHSKPTLAGADILDREASLRILEEELKLKAKELQRWENELKEKYNAQERDKDEQCISPKTTIV